MKIIDRIRLLCEYRGISLYKLEKDLEFGNGSLAKSKTIKNERLEAIADYFGVTIDYLMNGENAKDRYCLNDEAIKMTEMILANPEMKKLFDIAKDMSKESLEIAAEILMILKKHEKNK